MKGLVILMFISLLVGMASAATLTPREKLRADVLAETTRLHAQLLDMQRRGEAHTMDYQGAIFLSRMRCLEMAYATAMEMGADKFSTIGMRIASRVRL